MRQEGGQLNKGNNVWGGQRNKVKKGWKLKPKKEGRTFGIYGAEMHYQRLEGDRSGDFYHQLNPPYRRPEDEQHGKGSFVE